MKKPSRKTLKNRADKLWSEIIMKKMYCEVCGKKGTNPHHIIGRKNLTLRHDLRNGCLLCFQCHTGGRFSAHNDPIWFMNWMGENRKNDFLYLWVTRVNPTTQIDYQEVIERLEKKLKEEK